jgi:hypothetical protein
VLAAIGAGALAAGATAGGRALVTARHDATATALALAILDTERAGPRIGGADAVAAADGTSFVRQWTAANGRGAPDRLAVDVTWSGHHVALATEALP